MKKSTLQLLVILLFFSITTYAQTIVYVDAGNAGKTGLDGSTWEKAYGDLTDALRKVGVDKNSLEYRIAEGVYQYAYTFLGSPPGVYPATPPSPTSYKAGSYGNFIGGFPKGGADESNPLKYITTIEETTITSYSSNTFLYEGINFKDCKLEVRSNTIFSNCSFRTNNIKINSFKIDIINSAAINSSFNFENTNLSIINSIVRNSSVKLKFGSINVRDSEFLDSESNGLELINISNVQISNSDFKNNKLNGLSIDQSIDIDNSSSSITLFLDPLDIEISNSSFVNNLGSGFFLRAVGLKNKLTINNAIVDENNIDGLHLNASFIDLNLNSLKVSNNKKGINLNPYSYNIYNEIFLLDFNAVVQINNCEVFQNTEGLVLRAKSVNLENCKINSQAGTGLTIGVKETISLTKSKIDDNKGGGVEILASPIAYGALSSDFSTVENCDFVNNDKFGLKITNSRLKGIAFKESNFVSNLGTGLIIMDATSLGKIDVDKCVFRNNQGMGLSLQSLNVNISNSDFLENTDMGLSCSSTTLNLDNINANGNGKSGLLLIGKLYLKNVNCKFNSENGITILNNFGRIFNSGNGINLLLEQNGKNGLEAIGSAIFEISMSNFLNNKANGLVCNSGELVINNSNFLENNEDGLKSNYGKLNLKTTSVQNNKRNGMFLSYSSLELDSCAISNHQNAGVVIVQPSNSNYNFNNTIFGNNTSGLLVVDYANTSIINVRKCIFKGHTFKKDNTLFSQIDIPFSNGFAHKFSSAVFMIGGQLNVEASEFKDNVSKGINSGVEGNGGAITNYSNANSIITSSFFHNNSATGAGGAIYSHSSGLSVYNSVFTQNVSSNQGGAIMFAEKPKRDAEIVNCTFFDNKTYDLDGGGAVSNHTGRTLNIKNSIFYKNKQDKSNVIYSSDVYAKSGTLFINRSSLQLDSMLYEAVPNIDFNGIRNFYSNKNPLFILPATLEDSAGAVLTGPDQVFGTKDDPLRLSEKSPFLNIGVNSFNATTENTSGLDAAGSERIQNNIIDLGAYEGGAKFEDKVVISDVKIIEGNKEKIILPIKTFYGSPISYTFVSGPATLNGRILEPTGKLGKIVFKATAPSIAKEETFSWCVYPKTPTLSIRIDEGNYFIKSSSQNTIWYENQLETKLTGQEIAAKYTATYTAKVNNIGCESEFSNEILVPADLPHTIPDLYLENQLETTDLRAVILPEKTDLGNVIKYTTYSKNVIVNKNILTLTGKPGKVYVLASATKASATKSLSFCVNPKTPLLTLRNDEGDYYVKSNGQESYYWLDNGVDRYPYNLTDQERKGNYGIFYQVLTNMDGCYSSYSNEVQVPKEIEHKIPTIELKDVSEQTVMTSITLPEKTDLGNAITYTTSSKVATILGNVLYLSGKPGKVQITAKAKKAPQSQSYNFCVNPLPPKLTTRVLEGMTYIKSSSVSNNSWAAFYIGGQSNISSDQAEITAFVNGLFGAKIAVEGCESDYTKIDVNSTTAGRDAIPEANLKDVPEKTEFTQFMLPEKTNGGSIIRYTIKSKVAVVNDNVLTISGKAGKVEVLASAKDAYNRTFSFCVIPSKPTITMINEDGQLFIKSSSKTNNTWRLYSIDYQTSYEGEQKVWGSMGYTYYTQIIVEGCKSEASNNITVPIETRKDIPAIKLNDMLEKLTATKITLPEKTEDGDIVVYDLVSDVATIDKNILIISGKPGRVEIKGKVPNGNYNIRFYYFCVKPLAPTITYRKKEGEYFIKSTSPINNWIESQSFLSSKVNEQEILGKLGATYFSVVETKSCYSDQSNLIAIPNEVAHQIPLATLNDIPESTKTTKITLPEKTDLGNTIVYALTSKVGSILGNVLTLSGKPGKVQIVAKAKQTAKDELYSFCVNPAKPAITMRNDDEDYYLKTNTLSNMVWYENLSATKQIKREIQGKYEIAYHAKTITEGCESEFSNGLTVPNGIAHKIPDLEFANLLETKDAINITLPEKTDLGNIISYSILSKVASVNGNILTIIGKPGQVQLIAKAKRVPQEKIVNFCVNPLKPTISFRDAIGGNQIKSNAIANNVWYEGLVAMKEFNQEINGLNGMAYNATIKVDGCESELSNGLIVINSTADKIPIADLKDMLEKKILTTITLPEYTDSGTLITYVIASKVATLKNNVLTISGKPGKVQLTAKALNVPKDVVYDFCITPAKPTLTLRNDNGDYYVKSSATIGNEWYENNVKTQKTGTEILGIGEATYKVQVMVEGCISDFSTLVTVPKAVVDVIPTITIAQQKEGEIKTITLPEKTNLGSIVNYEIAGPATLQSNKLTLTGKPGLIQILGKANNAPEEAYYEFCVVPKKPSLTLIGTNLSGYGLKSSAEEGNIWFKNDLKISSIGIEISAEYGASYQAQVDIDGCVGIISEKIFVPLKTSSSARMSTDLGLEIGPNPVIDELTIKATNDKHFSIKVLDLKGRPIFIENNDSNQKEIRINFADQITGEYIIKIEIDGKALSQKIIKL